MSSERILPVVAAIEILDAPHPVSVRTSRRQDWETCQWLRCGLSGILWLPAGPLQPAQTLDTPLGPSTDSSLCLLSHRPSPCPSSLAIRVWTAGLGKWQEEFTKLTRQMSSGVRGGWAVEGGVCLFSYPDAKASEASMVDLRASSLTLSRSPSVSPVKWNQFKWQKKKTNSAEPRSPRPMDWDWLLVGRPGNEHTLDWLTSLNVITNFRGVWLSRRRRAAPWRHLHLSARSREAGVRS